MRLATMAESTGVSTDTFLGEITESVVKYSNAFIIKARLKENLNIPGLEGIRDSRQRSNRWLFRFAMRAQFRSLVTRMEMLPAISKQ